MIRAAAVATRGARVVVGASVRSGRKNSGTMIRTASARSKAIAAGHQSQADLDRDERDRDRRAPLEHERTSGTRSAAPPSSCRRSGG